MNAHAQNSTDESEQAFALKFRNHPSSVESDKTYSVVSEPTRCGVDRSFLTLCGLEVEVVEDVGHIEIRLERKKRKRIRFEQFSTSLEGFSLKQSSHSLMTRASLEDSTHNTSQEATR